MSVSRLLLIISGSIAAYKSLELIRLWKQGGGVIRCVLTSGAEQFVAPLAVAALSQEPVYQELFSLKNESEMGHIRLSREADLIVVAPASADLIAKTAVGRCDDLATAVLLASDKKVMMAPAMNPRMWAHPATQDNLATLRARGIYVVEPGCGEMACQEDGLGRMPEPMAIIGEIDRLLYPAGCGQSLGILRGKRALVTAGPTREPIDSLRYITNRSSARQGYAIARALAEAGALTTLVSGPSIEAVPNGVELVRIETAGQLLEACLRVLPVEVAICTAAVVDWQVVAPVKGKLKRRAGKPPQLELRDSPDTLSELARAGRLRPQILVGFAAESDDIIANARAKQASKGCDWMVANNIRALGERENAVHLLRGDHLESWPQLDKDTVADRLVAALAEHLVSSAAGT